MINSLIALLSIVGTLVIYTFARQLHIRAARTFTLPVIVSTFVILVILLTFHIPYETYMIGGDWINELLGPAVVALAYPLYQQRDILKQVMVPILCGALIGAIVGISTGILLAKWAGFDELIIYSLTPKSVTTPVAMAVTESLGGITPLAAVFVMIAGIGGVLMSVGIFKLFRIDHQLGRGVGLGSASHALGTAKALESSLAEGSISTIAMVVSAILVSILTPGMILLLI